LVEWRGVDTIIVAAGVSALQPLMAVAGVKADGTKFTPQQATKDGIREAVNVTTAATRSNYLGPLVAAITFVRSFCQCSIAAKTFTDRKLQIPLLMSSSTAPSLLLVSSLAAVIPAPTRALYASTKAASLVLYQALSIEHPSVNFSFIIPSTIEGDFRASAVDKGPIYEQDPNKHGLRREDVARRCIKAVDTYEKTVFMPRSMRLGHILYWIYPSFVEWRARRKYNYSA
jgi:NAD(P)-dependent dehydrogenase (short-subunit alcohol dehydrogenase family)